jgi:hypothetical protein
LKVETGTIEVEKGKHLVRFQLITDGIEYGSGEFKPTFTLLRESKDNYGGPITKEMANAIAITLVERNERYLPSFLYVQEESRLWEEYRITSEKNHILLERMETLTQYEVEEIAKVGLSRNAQDFVKQGHIDITFIEKGCISESRRAALEIFKKKYGHFQEHEQEFKQAAIREYNEELRQELEGLKDLMLKLRTGQKQNIDIDIDR